MRRVIKPFIVEKRNSGRKPIGPVWPQEDEQPRVVWPEALMVMPAASEPPAFVGRVLPALDESPAELPPTRRHASRKPMGDTPPQEQANDVQAGIEAEPTPASEPESVAELSEPVLASIDPEAVAATLMVRQGMARLPREEFRRGERWKARLPAAVHRVGRRRGKGLA